MSIFGDKQPGDSNAQTSGFWAAMQFPGNLWWILPLTFFAIIGTDYFFSKWDGDAFHPWWIRITVITIFAGLFIAWIFGVIATNRKKKS